MLGDDYFTIIREEEKFIELKSKNTGHCWLIFKQTYNKDRPVVLYHKHTADTKWYREHWKTYTVKKAVAREMADELLAHYTPEQLRMHFMSLGLSAKSVGFKPQVYMSQEEKTGIDMVLKKEIFLQMYITD